MKASLEKTFVSNGDWGGLLCFFIQIGKGEEVELNEIVDEVRVSGLDRVLVIGEIFKNPEIVELIKGLQQIGLKIKVVTDGMDSIDIIRHLKNVSFRLIVSDIESIKPKNINMLRNDDEIVMPINDEESYESMKKYLLTHFTRSNGEIIFVFSDKNLKERYLEDYSLFNFNSRVSL